jgi:RNA polymerase sigma-70 factor (ECF subfamily)
MKPDTAPRTSSDTVALWAAFRRPLASYLARRVRRVEDVDEVLQEVFLRIRENIDALEDSERVTAWIFQITRDVLIDFERPPDRDRQP